MKIGERIKAAIALNPEIAKNRAKLRALYYLHKHNPKNTRISIFGGHSYTEVSLYQKSRRYGEIQIGNVIMSPLSHTPYTEGLKQLADKGISGIPGVALSCVKKVLDNLKESAKL